MEKCTSRNKSKTFSSEDFKRFLQQPNVVPLSWTHTYLMIKLI